MMQSNELPADEGHQAFRDRKTPDDNLYPEDNWKHKEWQFSWDCEEQSNNGLFNCETGKI